MDGGLTLHTPVVADAPSFSVALRDSVLTPRDYQVAAIESARSLIREYPRLLLVLPTGGGKCLGLGTPVLRFDGRIVPVEEVAAGDLLMGPDSAPRRVLSTTRGRGPLYRIVPIKGEPWVCNDVHVLTLTHSVTGEVIDIDLPGYLGANKTFKHVHKQFSPPNGIDFAAASPLPLDPYFFGAWLGDGSKRLAGVALTKPDEEIVALAHEMAARFGLRVRTDGTSCPTHHVVAERGQVNPLLKLLREVAGEGTHIPHAYLTASRMDRAALLAGLLDTDGYLHNGGYDIVQLRPGYAEGLAFVARSLGLRALLSPKAVNDVTYWRVSISGDCSVLPLRIARKQAPPRRQKKCATRTGFEVQPIGEGDYAGFELDGDGRFLLGDLTVTHNTVIAALVIRGAVGKGRRVLFFAHRREIIAQSFWKLVDAGVPEDAIGVMMADGIIPGRDGRPYNAKRPLAPVQVASVQTLARRTKPKADVVFVDEAHHAIATSYTNLVDRYTAEGARVVGLTATPCRADGRGLAGQFDHLHVIAPPSQLIAGGYLAEPEVWAVKAPDLSGVAVVAGDYDQEQLGQAMDTEAISGNVIAEYQRLGGDRTGVVFAVTTAHSRHLAARFSAAGIPAEHVDGETDQDVRDAVFRRLATGETRVLCNVGIATEGWDLPRAKYLALARPTKSLGLFIQMSGRVLRPWESIAPVIVDHGGCTEEHGLPHEDREWELDAKKGKNPGKKKARRCPVESCGRVVPQGVRVCPSCGYCWPDLVVPVELAGAAVKVSASARVTSKVLLEDEAKAAELRRTINREVWHLAQRIANVTGALVEDEATALNREIVRRWRRRRPEMSLVQLEAVLAWVRVQRAPERAAVAPVLPASVMQVVPPVEAPLAPVRCEPVVVEEEVVSWEL